MLVVPADAVVAAVAEEVTPVSSAVLAVAVAVVGMHVAAVAVLVGLGDALAPVVADGVAGVELAAPDGAGMGVGGATSEVCL